MSKLTAFAKTLLLHALFYVVAVASAFGDGAPFVWNGADGGTWDTETENWLDGETACAWVNGTNALFAASAAGMTVSIDGEVQVASLEVATGGDAGVTLTNGTLRLAASGAITLDAPLTVSTNFLAEGSSSVTGISTVVYEPFLTKTSTLVFPGLKLDDIAAIQAEMGGKGIRSGAYTLSATGYHLTRHGTIATMQVQTKNGDHLLCVKVELEEKSDGIYAKTVSAHYIDGWTIGSDFDSTTPNNTSLGTSLSTGGYGVCKLRASTAVLRLAGDSVFTGNLYITNALVEITSTKEQAWTNFITSTTGGGVSVRGECGMMTNRVFGIPITDPDTSGTSAAWLASSRTLPSLILSRSIPVSAVMRGSAIGFNADALPYHIRYNDETETMTCQFQFSGNSGSSYYIKATTVEFKQDGTNVTAKALKAFYWSYANGARPEKLGLDIVEEQAALGTSKIQNYSTTQYGVKSFVMRCEVIPLLVRSGGTQARDLVADNAQVVFTDSGSRPNGRILARNGARIIYDCDSSNLGGGSGCIRLFESGSSLTPISNMGSDENSLFIFDNATLYLPLLHPDTKDGRNYFNRITLRNGGRILGNPIRCGDIGAMRTMTFTSEGTNANLIAAGFNMVNNNKAGAASNTLVLATSTDLTVSGKIYDFVQGSSKFPGTWVTKRGAATLTLSGANTFVGRLTVEAGTLSLGSNSALPANAPLVLANTCTVVCNATTNTTGELTLGGNATITLGDGALAFKDSSGIVWKEGATLTVTGSDDLPTRSLRFGTSASGLTRAQLKQIRYNGEKVALNDEGYLRREPKGTVITIN